MTERTHFDLALYESAYPVGIENNYWHIARNRVVRAHLPSRPGTCLEIGCGPGIVVDYLRSTGVDCWGCDLGEAKPVSPAASAFLKLGQDAFALDEGFRRNITTLLMLDVLEHLSDPTDFLKKCKTYFPNAKHVLITLPARQELWSVYDEFFGHFLRYERDGALALCRNAGFDILRLRYFFHGIYLPMRAMVALKIQRSTKNRAPQSALARLIHRIVGIAMWLEAKLLPPHVPGTSLIILARFKT